MSHVCAIPTITYATLWAKWQIVIPKEAREKLHVEAGDRVVLVIDDGKMMVINPDGVQHMIRILQEGMESEMKNQKIKPQKLEEKKKKKTEKKK